MVAFPIHPFPARMAPDVALDQCASLPAGSIVLDPMAGSGTVLRTAADQGLVGIGFDLDPLAVLMAQVWNTPVDPSAIRLTARDVVARAESVFQGVVELPWIDSDVETKDFVDFWFEPQQKADLRRLSAVLHDGEGAVADALRIALSRIIITKEKGASIGRDVSHSRPHRVFRDNDFNVMREFQNSADLLARRFELQPPPGNVTIETGDARNLKQVRSCSIDAVITSPPYLNAIDYIRGHRLSLVWLGHQVGNLRSIRSESIGSERAPDSKSDRSAVKSLGPLIGNINALPAKSQRIVERYLIDLLDVLSEIRRTLKLGGQATLVVGNSCLRGVFINNAAAVTAAANVVGLELVSRTERDLPPSRRYLPPPRDSAPSDLTKRMRTEVILNFVG